MLLNNTVTYLTSSLCVECEDQLVLEVCDSPLEENRVLIFHKEQLFNSVNQADAAKSHPENQSLWQFFTIKDLAI